MESGAVSPAVQKTTATNKAIQDYRDVKASTEATMKSGMANFYNQGPQWLNPIAKRGLAFASGAAAPIAPYVVGGLAAAGNVLGGGGRDTNAVYMANRDAARGLLTGLQQQAPGWAASGQGGTLMAGGETLGALGSAAKATQAGKAIGAGADALKTAAQGSKFGQQVTESLSALRPGVVAAAGRIGAAGAGGGTTAGLLTGLEGGDKSDIERNALFGTAGGAALEGVGIPAIKLAYKGAGDFGDWIGSLLKKAPEAGTISPMEQQAANVAAQRLAQSTGTTSANIMDKAAPFNNPMAGQMFGTQGQNVTAALARRGGATGDLIGGEVAGRNIARPAQLKSQIAGTLGVDPDAAAGNIDAMVQAGQASVAPKYADLTESPFGIHSPELEQLLTTRQGKNAMKYVADRAAIEGGDTEGLTWAPTEVPDPGVGVNPIDAPTEGRKLLTGQEPPPDLGPAPQVRVPRGRAEPPSQGLSLTDWMRRQGGGIDTGGELGAQDLAGIGAHSRYSPQQLSTLAEKAQSAGYFPPATSGQDVTSAGELVQALMSEAAGKPIYARAADPKLAQSYEARAAAEEQNRSLANQHWNDQQDAIAAHQTQQQADAAELAAWHQRMDESVGMPSGYYNAGEAPISLAGPLKVAEARDDASLRDAAHGALAQDDLSKLGDHLDDLNNLDFKVRRARAQLENRPAVTDAEVRTQQNLDHYDWTMQSVQDHLASGEPDRIRQARQEVDHFMAGDGATLKADLDTMLSPNRWEPPPAGYSERAAPQTEPTPTTGLTAQSLVRLHQRAGDLVKWENGFPADPESKLMASFRQKLGALMSEGGRTGTPLVPGYQDVTDEAALYKGAKQAYNDFSGTLVNGKMSDFGKLVGTLSRGGKEIPERVAGAQAAIANDVRELYMNGGLKGGKFLTPGVQERLNLLFGPEKAKTFVAQMQASAQQQAAEARMAPFSNSSTGAMKATQEEMDQASAPGRLATIGGLVARGKLGQAAAEVAKEGVAWGRTAGSSVGFRDALGKIMAMKPEELQAFLKQMENMPPPPPAADTSRVAGLIGGAAASPQPGSYGMMAEPPPEPRTIR
jgi:hypothetical protein